MVQQPCEDSSAADSDIPESAFHQTQAQRSREATDVGRSAMIHHHAANNEGGRYWLDWLYKALNPYFYVYGCHANLQLSLIPRAERGLVVVKDWVRHMIYTNDPYKYETTFLMTFLRSAILSFDHNGNEAFDYINRARCMAYKRPPLSLIRVWSNQNVYILKDLINALHGVQPSCLSTGVMFVKHVVAEMLPININPLCDLIEMLCGSLVLSKWLQLTSTLHDVILPKSWLLYLTKDIKQQKPRDTRLYSPFVELMLLLLSRMHTDAHSEHLLFENRTLSRSSSPIRNVFIFCRALCLLGLNVRNPELRDKIRHGITALKKGSLPLPSLYCRYFEATQWGHLALAAEQSIMDSPMDEMFQLLWEAKMRGSLFAAPGVRHIVYVDLEKIPLLLVTPRSVPYPTTKPKIQTAAQDHTSHHPAHDAPSGPVRPAIPTETDRQFNAPTQVSHTISVDLGLADSEAVEEIEEQISTDQLDVDAMVVSKTAVHSMDSARADDAAFAHSKNQITAACVIQAMYRRHVLRRESGVKKALSEARSHFFIDCWVESKKMEWPHRHYRLLFLGPLPHLLLCLERANTSASDFKMKVKRRLTVAKHRAGGCPN
ncbi:hypothetical protein PILCRDRAFT_485798 [Piloderma croceum F 1598]|uniref:Uncharacterized protein n=1 Tax=Piloderma croceum (strain F 1598) TaxID=765440 RepID=A0A0C3FPP2_PILCF|nr:hypothetical protein PILCRDRAFT_485798 [Piloderma croceum F 1598]